MKEISLTKNQKAIVDDVDYPEVSKYKWYATWNTPVKNYYAERDTYIDGKRIKIKMHRFIMNTPKGLCVDHINHNTLDNRRSNLRNVTYSQNSINRRKTEDTYICKNKQGYQLSFPINNNKKITKTFKTKEEVLAYRNTLEDTYHKEYKYNKQDDIVIRDLDRSLSYKQSPTSYKYITYYKNKNKYRVRILVNKKRTEFGYYTLLEDAIIKRNEVCSTYNISTEYKQ